MAMRSLMAMLRPKAPDAGALYDAVVAEARRPAWYLEGGVGDSLDGRFAVLSSLAALAILRLEDGDEDAVRHSVALTESFIADMDAQMREAGFGDPSIGKQVRFMVGALASRVDWWRRAREGELDWTDAVRLSVYSGEPPESEAAVTFSSEALRRFNEGLGGFSDRTVMAGHIA
jgi:cytochrome b pre-mRNA-processing protein 3